LDLNIYGNPTPSKPTASFKNLQKKPL